MSVVSFALAVVFIIRLFSTSAFRVLLQLVRVRDTIHGVCYQCYDKRFEQQKGRPNVNACVAEKNFEEEL